MNVENSDSSDEVRFEQEKSFLRKEFVSISYEFNVLGFKGPRQMSVVVPGMDDKYNREDFIVKNLSDSLIQSWKTIEVNLRLNSSKQDLSNKSSSKLKSLKKSLFQFNSSNVRADKRNSLHAGINSKRNSVSETGASGASANSKNGVEFRNVVKLINKSPDWHKELHSFALDFSGRVTQASVKNFQIVHEINNDYIVMQFGKVNKDLYTCDFAYPLCALQAFGVALTSLDNKIGCD